MRHRLYGGVRGSLCKEALYSIPIEIAYKIITHLNPTHFMETAPKFQADGQHIVPLLGWENITEGTSDYQ